MRKRLELSGKTFGELTAIKIVGGGGSGRHYLWECLCSCGKTTIVPSNSLVSGHTKSCGHIVGETLSKNAKRYNEYIFNGNVCEGIIDEKTSFIFDSVDYEKVCKYKWVIDGGYVCSHDFENNYKKIRIHRIIMDAQCEQNIDHINRNKLDNRKENLRFATKSENSRNATISKNNKTGIIGVHLMENGRWRVSIQGKNGKRYSNFQDAVTERLLLEKEIFGEFAPQRHLFEEYGIE